MYRFNIAIFRCKPLYYLIFLSIVALSFNSHAEIYKWVDESGQLHYSDRPSDNKPSEKLKIKINSYTSVTTERLTSKRDFSTDKKVLMYSTAWCRYCKKARKHFAKNNIPFVEYDIEKNTKAKREYDALKGSGVPVILVSDRRMNGFSEKSFDRIYKTLQPIVLIGLKNENEDKTLSGRLRRSI